MEEICFYVKHQDVTYEPNCSPQNTVWDIKEYLAQEELHVSTDLIRLEYEGRCLDNSFMFGEFSTQCELTLLCTLIQSSNPQGQMIEENMEIIELTVKLQDVTYDLDCSPRSTVWDIKDYLAREELHISTYIIGLEYRGRCLDDNFMIGEI